MHSVSETLPCWYEGAGKYLIFLFWIWIFIHAPGHSVSCKEWLHKSQKHRPCKGWFSLRSIYFFKIWTWKGKPWWRGWCLCSVTLERDWEGGKHHPGRWAKLRWASSWRTQMAYFLKQLEKMQTKLWRLYFICTVPNVVQNLISQKIINSYLTLLLGA